MNKKGIYRLYWTNCNGFYIGRSNNIQRQYRTHLRKLKTGTHKNKLLVEYYKEFGNPCLEVLQEASSGLGKLENLYINKHIRDEGCCNSPYIHQVKVPRKLRKKLRKVPKSERRNLSDFIRLSMEKVMSKKD